MCGETLLQQKYFTDGWTQVFTGGVVIAAYGVVIAACGVVIAAYGVVIAAYGVVIAASALNHCTI